VREEPLTAAQSPFAHTTTEFDAAVVIVAEGAPVPAVDTVAGVAANWAPVQRVTVIMALCCPVWALTVALIVELLPPELTGAVYSVNLVCPDVV
jgi:hypothetical protein